MPQWRPCASSAASMLSPLSLLARWARWAPCQTDRGFLAKQAYDFLPTDRDHRWSVFFQHLSVSVAFFQTNPHVFAVWHCLAIGSVNWNVIWAKYQNNMTYSILNRLCSVRICSDLNSTVETSWNNFKSTFPSAVCNDITYSEMCPDHILYVYIKKCNK